MDAHAGVYSAFIDAALRRAEEAYTDGFDTAFINVCTSKDGRAVHACTPLEGARLGDDVLVALTGAEAKWRRKQGNVGKKRKREIDRLREDAENAGVELLQIQDVQRPDARHRGAPSSPLEAVAAELAEAGLAGLSSSAAADEAHPLSPPPSTTAALSPPAPAPGRDGVLGGSAAAGEVPHEGGLGVQVQDLTAVDVDMEGEGEEEEEEVSFIGEIPPSQAATQAASQSVWVHHAMQSSRRPSGGGGLDTFLRTGRLSVTPGAAEGLRLGFGSSGTRRASSSTSASASASGLSRRKEALPTFELDPEVAARKAARKEAAERELDAKRAAEAAMTAELRAAAQAASFMYAGGTGASPSSRLSGGVASQVTQPVWGGGSAKMAPPPPPNADHLVLQAFSTQCPGLRCRIAQLHAVSLATRMQGEVILLVVTEDRAGAGADARRTVLDESHAGVATAVWLARRLNLPILAVLLSWDAESTRDGPGGGTLPPELPSTAALRRTLSAMSVPAIVLSALVSSSEDALNVLSPFLPTDPPLPAPAGGSGDGMVTARRPPPRAHWLLVTERAGEAESEMLLRLVKPGAKLGETRGPRMCCPVWSIAHPSCVVPFRTLAGMAVEGKAWAGASAGDRAVVQGWAGRAEVLHSTGQGASAFIPFSHCAAAVVAFARGKGALPTTLPPPGEMDVAGGEAGRAAMTVDVLLAAVQAAACPDARISAAAVPLAHSESSDGAPPSTSSSQGVHADAEGAPTDDAYGGPCGAPHLSAAATCRGGVDLMASSLPHACGVACCCVHEWVRFTHWRAADEHVRTSSGGGGGAASERMDMVCAVVRAVERAGEEAHGGGGGEHALAPPPSGPPTIPDSDAILSLTTGAPAWDECAKWLLGKGEDAGAQPPSAVMRCGVLCLLQASWQAGAWCGDTSRSASERYKEGGGGGGGGEDPLPPPTLLETVWAGVRLVLTFFGEGEEEQEGGAAGGPGLGGSAVEEGGESAALSRGMERLGSRVGWPPEECAWGVTLAVGVGVASRMP